MNIRSILLRHIRLDGGTQARVKVDQAAVDEYAEAMDSGASFPAVVVFEDHISNLLWLGDGFHRVAAAEAAGKKNIKAEIRQGGLREARLFAIGANVTHGVRRSNADKRLAVSLLLDDPEWGAWSDREIARVVGVTHPFVSEMRKERVVTVTTPTQEKPASQEDPDTASWPAAEPGEQVCAFEDPEHHPVTPVDISQGRPVAPVVPLKAGPDDRDARIAQLERLVKEKDKEIEDLRERLADTGDLLKGSMEENESLHRILDAEDILAAFKKEVKAHQELARVTQSRNNGLMTENADLSGRLKSALRKIERIEKKAKVPDFEEVPA